MQVKSFSQPVASPPLAVWSFLSDPHNDRAWRQEITDVELLSGEPRQTGTTYRETIKWKQLTGDAILTISESVEGCSLVVSSEGPGYRSRSAWRFEQHGSGTLIMLVFAFETFGAMRIAETMISDMISEWLSRDLPLLEGHLSAAR